MEAEEEQTAAPTEEPPVAEEDEGEEPKEEGQEGEEEEPANLEDLTEDAEALKAELAKIVVHPPTQEPYVYIFYDPRATAQYYVHVMMYAMNKLELLWMFLPFPPPPPKKKKSNYKQGQAIGTPRLFTYSKLGREW